MKILLQLKLAAAGYLLLESGRFGFDLGRVFLSLEHSGVQLFLVMAYFFLGLLAVGWEICRQGLDLSRSYRPRWPHLAVVLGLLISLIFPDILAGLYEQTLRELNYWQLLVLASIPLPYMIFHSKSVVYDVEGEKSLFISDDPIRESSEDCLGFSSHAAEFADRVWDGGNAESLAFGLDAPWGIGKTSFVNLCKERWKETVEDELVIFEFSPIDYPKGTDLIDHFVDGLLSAIQRKVYAPEMDGLANKYLRSLQRSGSVSLFGVGLPVPRLSADEESTFSIVESILAQHKKKVIAIVDDLDRIDFEEAKQLLFVIRKGFALKKVNFLVVYDSQVLANLNEKTGAEEIVVYLEKFINVKASIFPSTSSIRDYLINTLPAYYKGTTVREDRIRELVSGILAFVESEGSWRFYRFFSDLRKLKRYVNTIVLAGLHELDLDEIDVNPKDLALLLLIYVNYPSTFRDIYNAESQGKSGLFSLNRSYVTSGGSKWSNSEEYDKYIEQLEEDPRFSLLNALFSVERVNSEGAIYASADSEAGRRTMACFNDLYGGRNLERYLEIIIGLNTPKKSDQYVFFVARFGELKRGVPIAEIFDRNDFNEESVHKEFWSYINRNSRELSVETAGQVIDYGISQVPRYSIFEYRYQNLRSSLPIYLTGLIDKVGWDFTDLDNSKPECLSSINSLIFNEDGVLDRLSGDLGPLSFNDLLMFKLYCSANRDGDIYNLTAALTLKSNDEAIRSGPVKTIAIEGLRVLAQEIFGRFNQRYISNGIDFVSLIRSLEAKDLSSQYFDEPREEDEVESLRNQLVSFILYQLAGTSTDSGIACGYYDPEGKADKAGIHMLMNQYLFSVCFDPSSGQGLDNFITYLVTQYKKDLFDDKRLLPQFDNVLSVEVLANYCQENRSLIEQKIDELVEQNRAVVVGEDKIMIKVIADNILQDIDKLQP